jgi:hypothetical protein
MKVIAIYPGRYQPWHLGHKSVYDALVRQFGVDNVYIATSDKVDPPRSPFNFAEKQQIIAATGIDPGRVVQTRDPYKAVEITSQYDPQDTKLLFAVSAKDMAEDPRFKSWTRRDGSPAYFQPAPNKVSEMEDFDKHGYIFVVPTLDFKVDGKPMRSATEFRREFAAADAATKASMTRGILGTDDPQLVKLLASKITEGKKMKLNDVVNETTAGAIGSVVVPLGATQRRKIKEVDNKKKPTPGDVLDHARRAREHTGQKPIKEVTEPKVGDEYTTSKGGTVTRTARGLKHTQSPTAGKDVKPGSPSKVPLDRYKLHSQPRSMFSGDLSEAAETGIFPTNAAPIQVGSTGNLVKAWQWTLSKLGLSTTIDGKFGNNTKQQTIKFQQENNITPSDGSVKPNTYSAANTVLQDQGITNNPFLQAVKTVVQRITGSLPNMPVAKTVFDFFKSKGYNDIQAAAFVGNFAHESGFSGSALNPNDAGSPSFGLAQWKLDRLEALKKFAAKLDRPYTDLATQLEFVIAELGRSHARANAALQATPNDLAGAVRAIQSKYEVGANYEPRFKFSQVALQQFAPETFASMTNQPAVSEGAMSDLDAERKEKQYRSTQAHHAKKKSEKAEDEEKKSVTKEGVAGAALGGLAGAVLTKSPMGAVRGASIGSSIQDLVSSDQDVEEGADDTVGFEVDSENAYNKVMKKFGSVIDWNGDAMVAPRKYWGSIQELAHDAGGAATEVGDEHVEEAWSQKYKNSINCSHPKGFSQKAHCAGKRKRSVSEAMEMTCPDCGMCKSHGSLTEIKKGQKDSNGYTKCWPGKHAEGTKKSSVTGKQVRNCVPNEGVTEDFKMKSDFRKESDAALADFLSRGGEIETVSPNRVRVKPGQSLASKHIGSKRETGRIVGKDRRVHGNKPVVNVSEVNDYFKRRKDEEDRIAGTKPPAKRTPQQTDYQNRRNREKQVGEAKQKPSAQERFNARLKTKHGIDLDAMERQWAERTKKIEAEIAALRKQEQQVSESYYKTNEDWKTAVAGAALAGAAALGGGGAQAADLSHYNTQYLQQVVSGEHTRPMVSIDDAKEELQARANGKQQAVAQSTATPVPAAQQSRLDYIRKLPQVDSIERTGGSQATVTLDGKEYQGTILQPNDIKPRFGPGTTQARVEAGQLGIRGLGSYVVYFVNDRAYIEMR